MAEEPVADFCGAADALVYVPYEDLQRVSSNDNLEDQASKASACSSCGRYYDAKSGHLIASLRGVQSMFLVARLLGLRYLR